MNSRSPRSPGKAAQALQRAWLDRGPLATALLPLAWLFGWIAALRRLSLALYEFGAAHARERGIILADTKFEFGRRPDGTIVLADEVLTPDSSRFWPADGYAPGQGQPSFDKQFVRDWASGSGWDKSPPAPAIPDDVVAGTRERYVDAYERIADEPFTAWLERSGS